MSEFSCGLQIPAPWIDHPNRDWAFQTQMLLGEVIQQLDEAALVLALLDEAEAVAKDHFRENNDLDSGDITPRLRRLHARSFVYSLDAVGQIVRVLSRMEELPVAARSCCDRFLESFGRVRDLRNSLQHIEDRLQGLGPHQRKIPASIIALSTFVSGRFCSTAADGTQIHISVSKDTLDAVCAIVQDLLWSFSWIGPGNLPVHREHGSGEID